MFRKAEFTEYKWVQAIVTSLLSGSLHNTSGYKQLSLLYCREVYIIQVGTSNCHSFVCYEAGGLRAKTNNARYAQTTDLSSNQTSTPDTLNTKNTTTDS